MEDGGRFALSRLVKKLSHLFVLVRHGDVIEVTDVSKDKLFHAACAAAQNLLGRVGIAGEDNLVKLASDALLVCDNHLYRERGGV